MKERELVTVRRLAAIPDLAGVELGRGFLAERKGGLTGFVHNGDPIRFVGYVEFAPMKSRGDHYHRVMREKLVILHGVVRGRFYLPETPENMWEIEVSGGDVVEIRPPCAHSFISSTGASALEMSPDLFRIEDRIPAPFDWTHNV